ncbi:FK506-binding protein 15 [Lampris incognitus]|uniref:FK506-binding protein 15 n=1 Tax=Lampris incognitus TaxID=2546036 RepID=UPI0024B54BF6|nr:FK506-binding protein 15 [Lampris incognitus]
MFGGEDEDGDFLSPTGGANLASLFGLDQATSQGNESFQYTAPKQPRKSSNPVAPAQKPAPAPGAPTVLNASAVQAFRYINGQYVKQGKLGAAVLGNHTTKEYKMLLYMGQQKQVTTARINLGFVFTVQLNNYCTFYDDQRQNWSLMFETEKGAVSFCKEVCLAKANSAPSLESVVVQELGLGEGQAVESGDSLEVAYTGWLLQNHAIGQLFDSNLNKDKLLRLKLGAGKVIKGWEEGMQGMKKAGRRLMVIPPSLAYSSKGVANHIPPNSTLVFEVELRRVKFARDSGSDKASSSSRDSAAPSPAPSPAPSMENLAPEPPAQIIASGPGRPGEPPLRGKSNSLNEQLANPDATKAKLISRMAKMGQPMLPFLTGVANQPDSSDSELEDTSLSRAKERPAAPSPVQPSTAAPGPAQVLSHAHTVPPSALLPVAMTTIATQPGLPGTNHAFQPYPYTQTSMAPPQLQSVGQVYSAQTVPYMGSGDVTSFLMTEARQHNTEIRLAVGKVADKVDQLASKVDDLQRQGSVSMGLTSMSMETSMIMHNIQRIVQENECLKNEVFEKSSRIEEQNRKIGELIAQNQRYMEQSNLRLEQRSDSLKSSSEQIQTRLLKAEQDKVHLADELASSTARVSQLQLEATSHQQRALELQSKLASALQDGETQGTRITTLEVQLEELKQTAEYAHSQYRIEKQKRKEMELRANTMEEEVQDLKTDKESLERTVQDRKRKWQAERQSRDEEVEELRRSSQQELDNVRAQLRKARTITGNVASEQLSQLQVELEEEWKGKCEQALTMAKEQHSRQMAELLEQKDTLEHKLTVLQEKFTALKQSRESEEQASLQQQEQNQELSVLQEKYAALEKQSAAVKEKLEGQVSELERNLAEQCPGDIAGEVKRVMNGVFHSLRGEFDLNEYYTGQAVLGAIVSTIKNVTLQLLKGRERPSVQQSKTEEQEEEEEDEESDVKEREERPTPTVHVNGEKKEEVEEQPAGSEPCKPRDAWTDVHCKDVQDKAKQEVATVKEKPLIVESMTHSQSESTTQSRPLPTTQSEPQGLAGTDLKGEQEQKACSVTETSGQQQGEHSSESSEPANGQPEESSSLAAGQEIQSEANTAASSVVDKESKDTKEPLDETNMKTREFTGPPTNPPPPPNSLPHSTGEVTCVTEGVVEENGEEPFFQSTTLTKAPPLPTEEEEEDELSLKGHPPPAPLFGEDDDDEDDLDWLS